jgi:hypothetical protein
MLKDHKQHFRGREGVVPALSVHINEKGICCTFLPHQRNRALCGKRHTASRHRGADNTHSYHGYKEGLYCVLLYVLTVGQRGTLVACKLLPLDVLFSADAHTLCPLSLISAPQTCHHGLAMYGHVATMAAAVKKGVDSVDGVEGIIFQVRARSIPAQRQCLSPCATHDAFSAASWCMYFFVACQV